MFLNTLDQKEWQDLLSEFNQKVKRKVKVDEFKEELWDTVVGFGKAGLMATGLDEKARAQLLGKMIRLRETKPSTESKSFKDILFWVKKFRIKKFRLKLMIKVNLLL